MLEKRKDESESVQKYQGMLMAAIIGGLLLFIAPVLVVYITGVEIVGDQTAEDALFALPDESNLPDAFTTKVNSIFVLVIWVARIVVVLFIVMAVIMLCMPKQPHMPPDSQKHSAATSKPAVQQ